MTNYQRQDDSFIAAQIREIKPPGCTCYIQIDQEHFDGTHSIDIQPNYRCHAHYPETSAALKGSK